ncbi:MAG: hypothetical protein HRF42_10385 [Candidatus Brocadia sp.]
MKTSGKISTMQRRDIIPCRVEESDQRDTSIHYTTINYAIRDLRISVLLTFVGINLKFFTGNVINALIFFRILRSGNSDHRYDIHTPSTPDMCGDTVMTIVFAAAYLFITSNRIKNVAIGLYGLSDLSDSHLAAVKRLKRRIRSSKNLLSLLAVGFSLYFLSKYFLSPGLEVIFIENSTPLCRTLNTLNDMIKLCNPLIFAYVYCKHLMASKSAALLLSLFFVARNLFATNVLGLITNYDIHVGAPFLDVLSPLIIVYSLVSFVSCTKTGAGLRAMYTSDTRRLAHNTAALPAIPAPVPRISVTHPEWNKEGSHEYIL